ncbi:MAG TPA: hotdog fold thioesterase [Candidatus Thioglobus sp.]|jgi:1,4-dihydroxy-2-naphthoyl-CoA hydrolase|nr:hotdog fold thioesterase [Candidatus Thioglobus sp.]HIL20189.1 hotdog fold thioesterase [Candidatus Thioglobus sp.]
MIWFKDYTIEEVKVLVANQSILDQLGIEFVEIGKDYLKARMPVDNRTHQIHGILHGGATCVLAETIGSIASVMSINLKQKYAVGSVISANHLRSVINGYVTATCTAIHIGRQKHVWRILVRSDKGKLISTCELTCAVVDKF